MVDKIKTGIKGLDEITNGGFRRNMSILLTGSPGTGKTITALQFLYAGAKDFKENGLFISTEENLDDIRGYAKDLGMDLDKYEKKGSLILYEKSVSTLKGGIVSIDGLLGLIKKNKIKRIALDSIIFFEYMYSKDSDNRMEFRRQVIMFLQQIKKAGVTFLTIAERSVTDLDRLEYDLLDFIFDAIILVTRARRGAYFERLISVIKVRGQEHNLDVYPLKIGAGGITILTDQTPFSLVQNGESKNKI